MVERDVHPCPTCHSDHVTIFASERNRLEVTIVTFETDPPTFDYEVHERDTEEREFHRVRCDACGHAFHFDLEQYQEAHETPYEHDSSASGCREGCEACAWDAEHGA